MTRNGAASGQTGAAGTQFVVLCLGLLIGFVAGFVLLLSNLPVDNGLTDYDAYPAKAEATQPKSFDFYQLLPGRVVEPKPERELVEESTPVVAAAPIQPATRVVPANAQIVNPSYTEVPANFAQPQQSWFLQAGRFSQYEQAQTMRAQVLLLGLEAFIVTREEAEGTTAHRVRIGPFYDQNLLTEAKKRMRRGGINYEIVRVTG